MSKQSFTDTLNNKILPKVMKIGELKAVGAIRDGFAVILPLIMAGSFFLICINLPTLLHFDGAINAILGNGWGDKLAYAVNATFNIMGLAASASIAYFYAREHKIEPFSPAIANMAAYMLTIPLTKAGDVPLGQLGSLGLFVAIVLSFLTVHVFKFMQEKHIEIHLPESVPPNVAHSFSAMFPTIAVVVIVLLVRLLVEGVGMESINSVITIVLGAPLKKVGGGYLGGLAYVLVVHLLWAVGIHGGNIANSIMSPIFLQQLDENRKAVAAGLPIPNIISDSFWVFVHIGGSGVVLALALLIVFRSKSAQNKQLGKLGIGPTLFSINEPIMFGLPVIFNPIILIPYVVSVVVVFTISYYAMYSGLVPRTNGIMVHWTTPVFVSGYLVTGSIRGVLLQLVNMVVATLIYLPFFTKYDQRIYDKEMKEAEKISAKEA
ncbi:PTS sugar transporter subunit IIC [Lacticaseibacillus daqingensis]|uniref:PTS sugar transporter subunit IIC n=1 Tax=Lacticaseibacillus daqingensis TaxID=2486014 RepID=UPI000F7B9CB2|nr:PTS transporter subunit EIIC [Lacticaseibacillus daqingensis]